MTQFRPCWKRSVVFPLSVCAGMNLKCPIATCKSRDIVHLARVLGWSAGLPIKNLGMTAWRSSVFSLTYGNTNKKGPDTKKNKINMNICGAHESWQKLYCHILRFKFSVTPSRWMPNILNYVCLNNLFLYDHSMGIGFSSLTREGKDKKKITGHYSCLLLRYLIV